MSDETEDRTPRSGRDRRITDGGGNGGMRIIKDLIQYALIPLIALVYWQLSTTIDRNGELLRTVQTTQIRVVGTIQNIQLDLSEHETRTERDSVERGKIHHTSMSKSCLECKGFYREVPPAKQKTINPFTGTEEREPFPVR